MSGFIGLAPIYFNGLLALLFVFVLPGVVFVRAVAIPSFPLRWFVVFLSSLTANHLLVTLIAALHLDPLETYRLVAGLLIAILFVVTVRERVRSGLSVDQGRSVILLSDVGWLLLSLIVVSLAYFNVWKHGVPSVFEGGDVSSSWNLWSLLWSQGNFPTFSLGYPQFVPTIWAVTYIFTGSKEQYFAFYIYIVWIIAPIGLNAMALGRISWWRPLISGFVFVWFVAEIQDPWLRSTLEQGYPDWVAAIFGFCGAVLFVANAPVGNFNREKMVAALVSLCLISIAAATKPLYGLFAIAVLIAVCVDAARYLPRRERNRVMMVAVGLVSVFVAAYIANYAHLAARSMPNYPVSEVSERFSRAAKLLNTNFTLPFRALVFTGLLLSPFLARARWLALPLVIGFSLWANTASYDLRNLLGLLMISAFIPLHALARAFVMPRAAGSVTRWNVSDGAVAIGLAILGIGLTLTLAQGDKELKQRFTDEQLRKGPGLELNQHIEQLLRRGCEISSAEGYIFTIAAFEGFRPQMKFFHFTEPLNELLVNRLNQSTGCKSIFYSPDRTHPSILDFIAATSEARGYTKVAEGNGMVLLVSTR